MVIMTILKVIFVMLLCVPLAYFGLRLIVQLIDHLLRSTKKKGKAER